MSNMRRLLIVAVLLAVAPILAQNDAGDAAAPDNMTTRILHRAVHRRICRSDLGRGHHWRGLQRHLQSQLLRPVSNRLNDSKRGV